MDCGSEFLMTELIQFSADLAYALWGCRKGLACISGFSLHFGVMDFLLPDAINSLLASICRFSTRRRLSWFGLMVGMMLWGWGAAWATIVTPSVTATFSAGSYQDLFTVQGDPTNRAVSLDLASTVAGKSWTATSSASWLKLVNSAGVTPSTLTATLDVSHLSVGLNQADITINAANGTFTVSIHVHVDPLSIFMLRSDPASSRVYALSDAFTAASPTYLIEVDSLTRAIKRVKSVGAGMGNLVVHHGDNRIYLRNWQSPGFSLYSYNLDTLQWEGTNYSSFPFSLSTSSSYDPLSACRMADGGTGRLIIETYDGSVSIYDTAAKMMSSWLYQEAGGGICGPASRYYYHGERSSYGAPVGIYKIDTAGGVLSPLKYTELHDVAVGSPIVVTSGGGDRVCWNGVVFDKNLKPQRNLGDIIYAMSGDGRFAFSESKIYDLDEPKVPRSMPVSTKVSAYNEMTGRLVVQNGSGIGFYSIVGLGSPLAPKDKTVVESPGQLKWEAVPVPGVTGYRVYLGATENGVSQASTSSGEYLGEVSDPWIALTSPLAAGKTYYWRVDVVVGGEVAKGDIQSFSVATIIPSVKSVDAATVQGCANDLVEVGLTSAVAGRSWTATASAGWVKLVNNSGVTPATLQVSLDASRLDTGVNQATITVTTGGGSLTLPVNLRVDPLALKVVRSDPDSPNVYAISEAVSSGATDAYLLEIDSLLKVIKRVVRVGEGATDLAIHHGDGRIYVPNFNAGLLLAVGLDDFAIKQTYTMPLYLVESNYSYGIANCYRVSAGGPGRVVFESQGGSAGLFIFNTETGGILASSPGWPRGAGAYDPVGHYYYHGGDNSSTAMAFIKRMDTLGDAILTVASAKIGWFNLAGTTTVLVSEDGRRVFWNGAVFDQDLALDWKIGDVIYSVSGDGRYAFSESNVYDTVQRVMLRSMPVSTKISAYNGMTGRLVVQDGSGVVFYNIAGPWSSVAPKNQEVVDSPGQLKWAAVPVPGVTGYRVYLGTTENGVSQASTSSGEYLGEVSDPWIALTSPLAAGKTYYWRVDVVVGGEVAKGDIQSFSVATIIPSVKSVDTATVQGYANDLVEVGLTSAAAGKSWAATASAGWVKLVNNTGMTPTTLQVSLDASQLGIGLNQAMITVTTGDGSLTLPVKLQVDPLAVTLMRSDPGSPNVYAISEAPAAGATRAYLLEVDSRLEAIKRVVPVGTGVTDFAVHHEDNRIYVSNWAIHSVLAVSLDTFAVERTYPVSLFASAGSNASDVYRLSAGGRGRLLVEANGAPIMVSIFNTETGDFVSGISQSYGGGGGYDAAGYYYHGDYQPTSSSGSLIHKLGVAGDRISSLAASHVGGANYYSRGSRTVVVSDNGRRVFWNGSVFTSGLAEEWATGSEIFTATPDGRIAFGQQSIYDVDSRRAILAMPPGSGICAYNASSDKLVIPKGASIGFYSLNGGGALPAPVLSVGNIGYDSVEVICADTAIESGFTLQKRLVGTTEWNDVSSTIPAYSTSMTATGLSRLTAYEFRVKAQSAIAESTWSNIVGVTTTVGPPILDVPANLAVANGAPINLVITASGENNHYTVTGLPPGMSFIEVTHTITGTSQVVGDYEVTVSGTNAGGTSSVQLNLTIGATSQNDSTGHYVGLTYGDAILLGTWRLDRTGNKFTGVFDCLGGKLKFSGSFGATGDVRRTSVTWSGPADDYVDGKVTWDRARDRITLTIIMSEVGSATTFEDTGFASSWTAPSHSYSQAGIYTAVMLGQSAADQPDGYGFLTVTIDAGGKVRIAGENALGEKVTWSGMVANNFIIPIYWKSADSFLWGIITVSSVIDPEVPSLSGTIAWEGNLRGAKKAYPVGFVQYLDILGNQFISRTAIDRFFTDTSAPVLSLGGGGLDRITEHLVQPFSLTAKGPVLPANNPYGVKLSINKKTGLVTGQAIVADPNPLTAIKIKRVVSFRGMMVRNADGAGTDTVGGYFLLPGWDKSVRSGWMEIMAP